MTPHLPPAARRWRRLVFWPTAALALAAIGCEEPAAVTKYETPRVEPRAKPIDVDAVQAALDHMFAAVVPAGDKAWFFKLVVRGADAAKELRKPFDDFLKTVEAKPGAKLPTWTLPAGWTEEPGDQMRAATIKIPHGAKELELSVTTLPLVGGWDTYLKVNVDRWMGQLGQSSLDPATIKTLSRTVSTKGSDATAFELVGTMQASPMGMAGMPPGHPPMGGEAAATAPPGPSGVDENADADAAPSGGKLTYDAPADWKPGAMNAMREAAFLLPADAGRAELAITRFNAHGEMAQLEPNVRRWAGQVGRRDLTADDIRGAATKFDVGGVPSLRFEFVSPEGTPGTPQAIVAIMSVQGDEVWFIKLWGDGAAVDAGRPAFDKFLASLKFPNGT